MFPQFVQHKDQHNSSNHSRDSQVGEAQPTAEENDQYANFITCTKLSLAIRELVSYIICTIPFMVWRTPNFYGHWGNHIKRNSSIRRFTNAFVVHVHRNVHDKVSQLTVPAFFFSSFTWGREEKNHLPPTKEK